MSRLHWLQFQCVPLPQALPADCVVTYTQSKDNVAPDLARRSQVPPQELEPLAS